MLMKPTPIPWGVRVVTSETSREVEILGANEQTIACNSPDSPTPISEADAVLIVRAVNNHDALVDLLHQYMRHSPLDALGSHLFRRGRALLAGMEAQ